MKISTITCHDVYNHGASLQAYALMTYLNNQGHSVEIIDYKPYYMGNLYKLSNIDNPAWEKNFISKGIYLTLKLPGRLISLKRKKNFDNFTKNYLNVGTYKYESNEDLKNNLPDSDAFICGSDQIWNSLHANGKDPAFYLDFVPENKIKAAYAASFATDTISDEFKPMTKSLVEKLDGVGVREESGVKIVKDLGIEKAVNVLDPVFLLEKENWDKIANKDFNEKYILIYDFDKSTIIEELAREISKKKGYKIYTINVDKPKYADKHFNLDGPETFVSLVKNAQFVISNSSRSLSIVLELTPSIFIAFLEQKCVILSLIFLWQFLFKQNRFAPSSTNSELQLGQRVGFLISLLSLVCLATFNISGITSLLLLTNT